MTNSTVETTTANNASIDLQKIEKPSQFAFVTWASEQGQVRKTLCLGRHLMGNSAFATIRVGSTGTQLCGLITVTQAQVVLKCTGPNPVMFADGKKMDPGETILVGDIQELIIGRIPVMISVSALTDAPKRVSQTDNPEANIKSRKKELSVRSGQDSFQQQIEDAINCPDKLRQILAKQLLDRLNLDNLDLGNLDSPEVREAALLKLRKIISEIKLPEDYSLTKSQLESQVYDEVMGLGPLESLLADESVTEIMVNSRTQIFVEKDGKLTLSDVSFSSDYALLNVIERIVSTVGRRIDMSSPIVDARLLDGSRVNAVIPPLALKGPYLTIRRFSKDPIKVSQLVGWGSLTTEMADFLEVAVVDRKNVMISGGTGSGKTTLLNALSSFIPDDERIVTIEDAAELQLQQEHIVSLETRPPNLEEVGAVTIRDLVKNSLRMRPDRIIVGECRGAEALDMLQAMNTGHDGSMTTAHANTPEDMLRRVETMVMMAGMDLPLKAIREQVVSAINVVVQQTRRRNGTRLVTDISWIRGLDPKTGEYDLVALFQRDKANKLTVYKNRIASFLKDSELDQPVSAFIGKDKSVRVSND